MPIDPDEESLPGSTLPVAKLTAPVVPTVAKATGPAAGLPWGVCGVVHEAGELSAHLGSRGVTRYVADGVRFCLPPLKDAFWKPTPGQADSFQMPWPDNPAQARTLAGFRRELEDAARAGRLRKGNDPILSELNHLAIRLCELAESLHRSRWTLGLIQPANVVLKTTPDGPEPVPVDLGFTWKGSYGPPPWDASPGKPAWLDSTGTDWLYDVAAVRRQFADPAETAFPPAEPIADVRVLARLFAWLLSGSRDADVRAPVRSSSPELWRLLAAAAAGQVATIRDFCDHLRDNPLSEHFTDPVELAPPPPMPKPKESGAAMLIPLLGIGFLLLLALGAGDAYFAGLFDKTKELAENPTTEPSTPSIETISTPPTEKFATTPSTASKEKTPAPAIPAEYGKAIDDLVAALRKKDGKGAAAALVAAEKILKDKKIDKLPPKEAAERNKKRDEFLNLWYADYEKIVTLSKKPTQRDLAKEQLVALEKQLKTLTDAYPTPASNTDLYFKEQQCLDFASRLSRQLASSP